MGPDRECDTNRSSERSINEGRVKSTLSGKGVEKVGRKE